MSNIYVHEPPTNGKVLLFTSAGDIEVELWSKEAPKACRNFVQLCLEGYYDNTIFHRLVKEFIVQGGDPGGDGASVGESVYGKPYADEFHSRIRFVRRGLVAMANSGPHDNTSHFFFTLAATPELNNKNTIFGRIGGDTIYNMVKMGEGDVGPGDKPLYPHKILKTKVLVNPFDDIVLREKKKIKSQKDHKPKAQSTATKNFALLSFGEEAEEDDDELEKVAEKYQGGGKSSHDLFPDVIVSRDGGGGGDGGGDDDDEDGGVDGDDDGGGGRDGDDGGDGGKEKREKEKKARLDKVKEKLDRKREDERRKNHGSKDDRKRRNEDRRGERERKEDKGDEDGGYDDPDYDFMKVGQLEQSSANRIKKFKKEANKLKKDLKRDMQQDKEKDKQQDKEQDKKEDNKKATRFERNLSAYESCSYKSINQPGREKKTLDILNKFKNMTNNANKITSLYNDQDDEEEEEDGDDDDDDIDDSNDLSWMTDRLVFKKEAEAVDNVTVKVFDANVDEKERYDISDPRNAIVARRRKKKKR